MQIRLFQRMLMDSIFTPFKKSHRHHLRLNCWDQRPFVGTSSSEPMGALFDPLLTHRLIPPLGSTSCFL